MTRTETLEELGRIAMLGHEFRVGVLFKNFSESRAFAIDFYKMLDEVPFWLRPKMVSQTQHKVEWENGTIFFAPSPCHLKGCSLSAIYDGSGVPEKYQDIIAVHLCGTKRYLKTFENTQ